MKRTFIFAGLLVAISGCTVPNQTSTNTPAANANYTGSPSPIVAAQPVDSEITAKEKQAWDAIKNKDYDAFGNLLADDSIDVSEEGNADKARTLEEVKGITLTDVSFADWKVITLDKDAAVVTYNATIKGTMGGQNIPSTTYRTSSAWVNRNGKWLSIYHQETPLMPPPVTPPGSASKTSSAKSAASPSASPAASPAIASSEGADPIGKEKQVWDALKRKDYAAFGNFLADDSIEVEADGVFDKAGSVKGVTEIDLSSATQSDFKEVKLDSDASLVTYLVKSTARGFDPKGERHSTIWVNRAGKWLAVFHQGTPTSTSQQAGK